MNLTELKSAYRIPLAWRDNGLPGLPGKCVPSPFRPDHSPSFSVFADDTRFKDHSTGDGGDVFDFIMKARGCNMSEALKFVNERLGVMRYFSPPRPAIKSDSKIPPLRLGTEHEIEELTDRRGFAKEALRLAEVRGFLRFTTMWGYPAWCICDQRQQLHEFRRLDGQKWPAFGRLAERKSHCIGVGKSWPLGVNESRVCQKIVMVEGAPDFLAAFHFIVLEGKQDTVAPVAVLGAANHRLAPESLAMFQGKTVCLYPHTDGAGEKAAKSWARALHGAGATRITAFDLSRMVLADGTVGKDLADLCGVSANCFEQERKFWEVMP